MQEILVAIILAASVAYTIRRLWLRLTTKKASGRPHCEGCPLADSCKEHQRSECNEQQRSEQCKAEPMGCQCCTDATYGVREDSL